MDLNSDQVQRGWLWANTQPDEIAFAWARLLINAPQVSSPNEPWSVARARVLGRVGQAIADQLPIAGVWRDRDLAERVREPTIPAFEEAIRGDAR